MQLDKDALLKRAAENKAKYAEAKEYAPLAAWVFSEYMISIHFLGENSLANAKELYPDLAQASFKEYVEKLYEQGGAP